MECVVIESQAQLAGMIIKINCKPQIVLCLPAKHLGVLENSFERVRAFQIELEFRSVGFRRGENRSIRREISRSKEENQQLMASTPGFEPGPLDECSHHCATLTPQLLLRSKMEC